MTMPDNMAWIKKVRRGMVLRFADGATEIVVMTGFFGKSDRRPERRGRYFIATTDRILLYWPNEPKPEFLGFADKRDMSRINCITNRTKTKR